MKPRTVAAVLLAAGMLVWSLVMNAKEGTTQTDTWQAVPASQVPPFGTFYLMSQARGGRPGPPIPANLTGSTTVWTFADSGIFVVDDRPAWTRSDTLLSESWLSFRQFLALAWFDSQLSAELRGMGLETAESLQQDANNFGTNLYLEVTGVTNANVHITAVNTANGLTYQLGSKTNLTTDLGWLLEQEFTGASGTNTVLAPVPELGRSNAFFRAFQSDTRVGIIVYTNFPTDNDDVAIEPNPFNDTGRRTATFQFQLLSGPAPSDLQVNYRIGGTASNGVDYSHIDGTITVFSGQQVAYLEIIPLSDYLIEGDETVVLTLGIGPNYLVDTNHVSATVTIHDTVPIDAVAIVPTPIGIDYHSLSNALVVSCNYDNGEPNSFVMIHSNGVVSNWSGVHGVTDEVKLATVKATAGGFTNGDMFFGNGTNIGLITADGTISNLNWCVLTNNTVTNARPLRGGLYVDQTGLFSNQLIVVTSDETSSSPPKAVWRVDAQAHPILLTNFATSHLEGVITLTNDVAKYGPLAGKIVTGNETALIVHSVAADGTITSLDTSTIIAGGIAPEDFDIIPANQNLYACDPFGLVLKVSSNFFTSYVGDLLVTQGGEFLGDPKLFILHWNGTAFETHTITYQSSDHNGRFEHVTFAPIDLPLLNP